MPEKGINFVLRSMSWSKVLAYHISGLDSSKAKRSVPHIVWANIGHKIEVLGCSKGFFQPPSKPIDSIGKVSIRDSAVAIIVGGWRIGVKGIGC